MPNRKQQQFTAFNQQSQLVMLIECSSANGLRPEHLVGLAPFLPQAMIDKLALGYKPEPVSELPNRS
jgi:hypothetical protein